MRSAILKLVVVGVLFASRAASAQLRCLPESFGPLTQDPITIDDAALPADCTLDFGARAVVIAGTLRAAGLTLMAADLTITPAGRLEGGSGITRIFLTRALRHTGSADMQGALSHLGFPHGGGIEIEADGDVTVTGLGLLEASVADEARGANGGYIAIDALGTLTTEGRSSLTALAGNAGDLGGEISLAARSIVLGGPIEVRGGSDFPGAVVATALADLTVRNKIQAAGSCSGETCALAGVVKLTAGTDLQLLADIAASAGSGNLLASEGAGGQVMLDAEGTLGIKGSILLASGEGSRGGTFTARAGGGFSQAGSIDVSGGGRSGDSSGGVIEIRSEKGADIDGVLDANGGMNADAGSIAIVAEEDVSIGGELLAAGNFPAAGIEVVSRTGAVSVTTRVDTSGIGPFGAGGSIGLFAVTDVLLDGANLIANGSGEDGFGGTVIADGFASIAGAGTVFEANGDGLVNDLGEGGAVALASCQLLLGGASDLQASGETGGHIVLQAADALEVAGKVLADAGGLIEVRHASGQPPVLERATFAPDPLLIASPAVPCLTEPPCEPVTDLSCRSAGTTVHLAWSRGPGQSQVQIIRDGSPVATLDTLVESFADPAVPLGDHAYEVVGLCAGRRAAPASCGVTVSPGGTLFSRGDCNPSRIIDISDPIFLLGHLFQGRPNRLGCPQACDANDDGKTDIADAVRVLSFLFLPGVQPLPPPFRTCGLDETPDGLACEEFGPCV